MHLHKFNIKLQAFSFPSADNEQWLLWYASKGTLEKEYVIICLMRGKRERDC